MRIIRIVAILAAVAFVPLLSHAAEGKVTSSTQYLWYQDFQSADKDQSDLAEYLRLDATKLDKEGNISLHGYGRVLKQFSTSVKIVRNLRTIPSGECTTCTWTTGMPSKTIWM